MTTFTLRGGFKVRTLPLADGSVTFETENSDGDVISTVTYKRVEANRLLSSLCMISTGRLVHDAA